MCNVCVAYLTTSKVYVLDLPFSTFDQCMTRSDPDSIDCMWVGRVIETGQLLCQKQEEGKEEVVQKEQD